MTLGHGPDEEVGPETLGVIRAAVFAMWLVEAAPDPLSFWGELPRSMHRPVGVFKLVPAEAWDRVLEPEMLERMQAVLVVLVVLSMVGAPPYQPIAVATAAVLTAQQALLRGFTFVNHEELCLLISTYVLALFPAADGFAWPTRRRRRDPHLYTAAVRVMALLLLVPYSEIAARRIVRASPAVFFGDSVPHWLASLDALDPGGIGIGRWLLARPALVSPLKAGFAVTTAFELVGPVCLVRPKLRRPWIAAVVGMHLLNRFTLKLFFWQNSVLILLLLTGPERWVTRARTWVRRRVSVRPWR